MMKKIFSVFLASLMLLSLMPLFSFAADEAFELSVNPYGNAADSSDTIIWYKDSTDNYYLFLPSDADTSALTVYFNSSDTVTVNGVALTNGEATDVFATGREYTLNCGGKNYSLNVLKSENLPAVYITTESGSLTYIHKNKENSEPGTIKIYENGSLSLDKSLKSMKGRGNATWAYAKKPYNIKFDKKTSVLGMEKAKKWTLVANYVDNSLQRNDMALDLAAASGLAYTSEYRQVDLYINGDYKGNYLICESVEVDSSRIDIDDLEKANENANPGVDLDTLSKGGNGANGSVRTYAAGARKWVNIPKNPADISGGYLLELENPNRWNNEIGGFVSARGQAVVVKSPEPASAKEVNYIADLYNEAERALLSGTGYNELGKHYSEYFDLESFAKVYILEDFAMEADISITSQFFYKKAGEDKFYGGPIWDFDNSFWNGDYNPWGYDFTDETVQVANQVMRSTTLKTFFSALFYHEDFRDKVNEIWTEIKEANGGYNSAYAETVRSRSAMLEASAIMDEFRWNKNPGCKTYEEKQNAYRVYADTIATKFVNRITYCSKEYAEDGAILYYDRNGASGNAYNHYFASIGDTIPLISSSVMSNGEKTFCCWNTEKDGSGTAYQSGGTITLTSRTTTLYAIWSDAHKYKAETVSPTCTQDGYNKTCCVNCGEVKSSETLKATGHKEVIVTEAKAATCTEGGNTAGTECSVCGAIVNQITETDAIGHSFEKGTCKNCGIICNCKCHSAGLMGFFYRLQLFFCKLFGIGNHRICDCGMAHW